MTFFRYVEPDEATGIVKEEYARGREASGVRAEHDAGPEPPEAADDGRPSESLPYAVDGLNAIVGDEEKRCRRLAEASRGRTARGG